MAAPDAGQWAKLHAAALLERMREARRAGDTRRAFDIAWQMVRPGLVKALHP